MFVCKQCTDEQLRWSFNFMLSRGPCECCGFTKDCKDIPSSAWISAPDNGHRHGGAIVDGKDKDKE